MSPASPKSVAAFDGHRMIAAGSLGEVALAVKSATEARTDGPLLVFDDATGAVVDLDLRGTQDEIVTRYAERQEEGTTGVTPHGRPAEFRGRGRPKLGVVAREVTLLPRHWDWLSAQPGGASASLRRLVNDARRADGERTTQRAAREAAYRFMSAMAGDLPGFEEAARALFARDQTRFAQLIAAWPSDLRDYVARLAPDAVPTLQTTRRRL